LFVKSFCASGRFCYASGKLKRFFSRYKITSNIESGHGRSDIRMESLFPERPHIVIEFKQGEDVNTLKEEALAQILDKKYHQGLDGDCLCIGIAHNIKECAIAWLLTR